jgi:endonuclease YncB( thermonuclease family)
MADRYDKVDISGVRVGRLRRRWWALQTRWRLWWIDLKTRMRSHRPEPADRRFLLAVIGGSAAMFVFVLLLPEGTGRQALAAVTRPPVRDLPDGGRFDCHVLHVHDGDGPLHCRFGPKVRLTAIAAREADGSCRPGHPCPAASAEASTAALRRLAMGETLQCEKTGVSYQRVTAWCWRDDGVELNCAMVEGGHAAYWRRFDPGARICQ